MGIKQRFILRTETATYRGPAIYYRLRDDYDRYFRGGYLIKPFSALTLATGGWRKKVPALFEAIRRAVGPNVGSLRVLKARNPRKTGGR